MNKLLQVTFSAFATFVIFSINYPIHLQTKMALSLALWKFERQFIFHGGNQIIILVFAHASFCVLTWKYDKKLAKLLQSFQAKQVNAKARANKECC